MLTRLSALKSMAVRDGGFRTSAFKAGSGFAAAVALIGCALLVVGNPQTKAEAADKSAFSADQKSEIEEIVRSYLLANPEIFLEVQQVLEKRLQEEQERRLKNAVSENSKSLFRRVNAPIAGNPEGDVTVVEFFDYNCGFCKRGFKEIEALIKADDKVKVVFKEFPIFGKGSEDAARVALAAKNQGKYWEVHKALLELEGRVDGPAALSAAEKLGLDVAKLKADMTSKPIDDEILQVRDLAQKMGINGTPHFLVGDRTIAGAPEDLLTQFKTNLADIRNNGGCKIC